LSLNALCITVSQYQIGKIHKTYDQFDCLIGIFMV